MSDRSFSGQYSPKLGEQEVINSDRIMLIGLQITTGQATLGWVIERKIFRPDNIVRTVEKSGIFR
jgi:hypothetical protein